MLILQVFSPVKPMLQNILAGSDIVSSGLDYFNSRVHLRLPIIPRLHDQAGSTSWLYVNWTSQFDVCSTFARCLLDVCHDTYPLYTIEQASSRHRANVEQT